MENVLQEADRLTSKDRNREYGHPSKDFARVASMWSMILGHPVRPADVPLMMIALKMSRQVNKPNRDNMVDICGYARTWEMCCEAEKQSLLSDDHLTQTFGEIGYAGSKENS